MMATEELIHDLTNSSDKGVLVNLYKTMLDEHIICAYHGTFSYEVVDGLLKDIKNDLQNRDVEKGIAIKTYNILVECLENVYRHSVKTEQLEILNEGLFVLSGLKDNLNITIGNLITAEDAVLVKQTLEEIKHMTKDELREKYNNVIQNGSISEKGGAGLGILDMAMKSNNKIDYELQAYKNNLVIFILKIKVSKN